MTARFTDSSYHHHRGLAPLLRPSSRLRMNVFLGINLAGFAVVNAFWQYLASGRWVNLSLGAFQEDLRTPLGEIFLQPLSIFTHPWMLPVTGLLLAVVIFVPIIVAVLHRLIIAAAFVAIVAVLGHTVVLAMAIAVGCILAARTPLRSDMPFLAATLGLVPVALYLYLFGLAGVDSAVSQPLQRWVLRVPFLIAVVSGVLGSAAVVGLARLTGYRPGVVWPVLAVLLATPLTMFYVKIGADELDYSLIVSRLAPGDAVLESASLEAWQARYAPGLNRQKLPGRVEHELKHRKGLLVESCDRFLQRHPRSERTAAVLWIKAQCLSVQYDAGAFEMGLVKFTADYPLPESEPVWQELSSRHKGTAQAALADWRLAELALRRAYEPGVSPAESQRRVKEAHDRLAAAEQHLATLPEAGAEQREIEPSTSVFSEAQSVPTRSYYADALFAVRRLRWLMEESRALEDANSAEALSALLAVNPHQPDFYGRLGALLSDPVKAREQTEMGDVLKLEVAKATLDRRERAAMFRALADGLTGAAIEANYELGILLRQESALQAEAKYKAPEEYFKAVRDARKNPWTSLAEEMLARLAATTKPKDRP